MITYKLNGKTFNVYDNLVTTILPNGNVLPISSGVDGHKLTWCEKMTDIIVYVLYGEKIHNIEIYELDTDLYLIALENLCDGGFYRVLFDTTTQTILPQFVGDDNEIYDFTIFDFDTNKWYTLEKTIEILVNDINGN